MKEELIVKLSIRCPKGAFDISKMLYEVPRSIIQKQPADYTKEDIETLEKLKKVKKVTHTVVKSLVPDGILKEIEDAQYAVKKAYNEYILMPEMPLMSFEDYKNLKKDIKDAEEHIAKLQEHIEANWKESVEKFREDLFQAYPDAPIENLEKIVKSAESKKNSILNNFGFKMSVTVVPNVDEIGVSSELKEVLAQQRVEDVRMILESAVKEAFKNVSYVYLAPIRQKNNQKDYLLHGKTLKRIPTFAKDFRRKMSVIGNNDNELKKVQKGLDELKDADIMNENDIVNKCGELTYLLINIAKDKDIELDIDENINVGTLELQYS